MKLTDLSNEELLSQLDAILCAGRRLRARLIAYLIEVEERRLHLDLACSSLFDFCVRRLGMSEGEAFRRINAARLAKRIPGLLGRIERGEIHLSALVLLRDHLDERNHAELLDAARGKTKREVQEIIAARFPKPDVPAMIRKLPAAKPAASVTQPAPVVSAVSHVQPNEPPVLLRGAHSTASSPTSPDGQRALAMSVLAAAPAPMGEDGAAPGGARKDEQRSLLASRSEGRAEVPPATNATETPRSTDAQRARIEPLSPGRYKVQLTASAELREKIERATALMRHRNPSGDLAVVVERAMDLLIAELEKERLGKTRRPPKDADEEQPTNGRKTRPGYVPRAVRRQVFERDGEQCTFVDEHGRRCPARAFLELDHIVPRALGGTDDADNLRVACRMHNQREAERAFGRAYVEERIRFRQRKQPAIADGQSV